MKLIIAEKKSVAENIAHTLGAYGKTTSKRGTEYCFSNEEYYIAFANGHLYSLAEPDEYGYSKDFKKSFANGELPMIPEFKIVPTKDESKKGIRQYLDELINNEKVTEIICATDAAREGELIFREIYEASGSTKPVKRLWISSVTEEAIKTGMENLKPSSEYDNLYRTAKVRTELDWLYGMNLSRLYTALDDGYVHSVGRVITPVLGIIVNRDKEIKQHIKTVSYKLELENGAISTAVYSDKSEAEAKAAESTNKNVSVEKAERKEKSENRPLLYSLTTLQMDANDIYGYTADETLAIAQKLYEKRMTTYPRSESEYIGEDMKDTVLSTVKMLLTNPDFEKHVEELLGNGLNLDKRVINNEKLTDHHAIIPALQSTADTSSLSEKEKNIYNMIANRLLMALDKEYLYEEIIYEFWCEDITYTLTYKKPLQMGWKAYRPKYEDDAAEAEPLEYTEGSTFSTNEVKVKECVSQPPKHFTDKTLLSVMNNIDNRIEDTELKSAVKGKGIGTIATRAAIIEKLINCGYVVRKNKNLLATDFGTEFVNSLPRQVLSVERTAEWEQEFEKIANGGNADYLYDDTKTIVSTIINYEKSNTDRKPMVNPNAKSKFTTIVVGSCPRCGEDIVDKGTFYGCSSYKGKDDSGCGFSFSKKHRLNWYKGEISVEQAKKLLRNEIIKLKTVSKENVEYTAEWKLQDDGLYVNVIKLPSESKTKTVIAKCPRCGEDIIETSKAYSCSSYKGKENSGCGYALFKHDNKWDVDITAAQATKLIEGKTVSIKRKTPDGTISTEFKLTEREVNGKKWINLVEKDS